MLNNVRGRHLGGASARKRLLDAAQRHFEVGDQTEICSRNLANEVGVSHILVNYYFGSRDDLIAAAVSLRVAPHHVIAAAIMPDGKIDFARLARGLIAVWEHPEQGELLTLSSPANSSLVTHTHRRCRQTSSTPYLKR